MTYTVLTFLILAFWGYTLWWAFTTYDPTPFADEVERWTHQQPINRRLP